MIELPEASHIADQINKTLHGKRIVSVTAAHSPHKLAWYYGDRTQYSSLLAGSTVGRSTACGCMVEIAAGKATILLGEGVGIRFHAAGESRPAKHQFLIEFDDRSALSASVQMYGGMGCFPKRELDNPYYKKAKEMPSPLTAKFDESYFDRMVCADEVQKLSLKALLATEQRIPGLGNGILQDILFISKLHPKRKTNTLSDNDRRGLFNSVKTTIARMAAQGGRDIELDLFGHAGGYRTILSRKTVNEPCPLCGTIIKKENYMGGAIYYCEKCQV
jgi:formamidopyrimidine-DNA glycosylase